MNHLPDKELIMIPGGTLITKTSEEGRALAMVIARHTIHNIQPDLDILKAGRSKYSSDPDSLTRPHRLWLLNFKLLLQPMTIGATKLFNE